MSPPSLDIILGITIPIFFIVIGTILYRYIKNATMRRKLNEHRAIARQTAEQAAKQYSEQIKRHS